MTTLVFGALARAVAIAATLGAALALAVASRGAR
jgi:hypothetical protein